MAKSIPEKNLELMLGKMLDLLREESIGGNAGFDEDEGYPCAAVNFYYDKDTGEIEIFTNDVIENNKLFSGFFKLLTPLGLKYKNDFRPMYFKISGYLLRDKNKSSKIVIKNLEESINLYNAYMEKQFEKNKKLYGGFFKGLFRSLKDFLGV